MPTAQIPHVARAASPPAETFVLRPGPLGPVFVAYNTRGISACSLAGEGGAAAFAEALANRHGRPVVLDAAPPDGLMRRVDTVLRGGRANLEFDLACLGPFARAVLARTAQIPPGEVRSYRWVAEGIGRPLAVRAVGTALAHNPVPLLIPCHRVIRSDGRIGDYAFGAAAKQALLAAERAMAPGVPARP